MKDISSWDVYLVTDRSLARGVSNKEIVRESVRAGVSVVQLREKCLSAGDFLKEGLRIKELLADHNVPLIINDRIDIALALDAEGVHLGQSDMPLENAREILGPDKIIGLSVNDLNQINLESASLVDYFAISPVFFTSTKENITQPWGIDGVRKARSTTSIPLVGIGGIGRDNAHEVVIAGLDCIAVVSAIVSEADPFSATENLIWTVRNAKRQRVNQRI
jgi:thiamine-phosphate pyrophosphorylase